MSSKKTQLTHHENVTIERHFMAAPGEVALESGVTIVASELNRQSPIVPRLRLKLTDFVVTVPNADNFGAMKLLTLADNNLEFKWAMVDLAAVVLGFTTNTVAAVEANAADSGIQPGDTIRQVEFVPADDKDVQMESERFSRIEPIPCGLKQWEEDDASAIIEIARRNGIRITL